MTIPTEDPRIAEGASFQRWSGKPEDDWQVWTCAEPEFRYVYNEAVTLFVHSGTAEITFADGDTVDLRPGDRLLIRQGASAVWTIHKPIRNSWTPLPP